MTEGGESEKGMSVVRFIIGADDKRQELHFNPESYGKKLTFDQFCILNPDLVRNYDNEGAELSFEVAVGRILGLVGSFDENNYDFRSYHEKGYVDASGHFTELGFKQILGEVINVRTAQNEIGEEKAGLARAAFDRRKKERRSLSPEEDLKIGASEIFSSYGFEIHKIKMAVTKVNEGDFYKPVWVFVLSFQLKDKQGKKILKSFSDQNFEKILENLEDFLRNLEDT